MLVSYHNDQKLKSIIVEEMENHRAHDQIIKGTYGHNDGKFRGCAVGCAIDSMNVRLGKNYKTNQHNVFEEVLGIPEWLARLSDTLFEGLPEKENSDFAVNFLKAIPVGVNLEPVKRKFCVYILKENIERVLSLDIDEDLKKQVVDAIKQCLSIHESAIIKGMWDESAASAARSAAESAARSASWSAAESAAYKRYAKELLRLLEEA